MYRIVFGTMFRRSYHFHKWLSATRQINTQSSNSAKPLSAKNKKDDAGWTQWEGILKRFIPIGVCLIAVMQWRAFRRRREGAVAKQWEIDVYCFLPLRTVSRCFGYIADKPLPESVRPYVYRAYANTFGVDISEAKNPDLKSYPSLTDFFVRSLKDGVRTIDERSCLVSPCDGTVLSVGTVNNGQVEQVKGVTYYVRDFLGEQVDIKEIHKSLLHQPHKGNTLYQCVIYLAPGDYHRFHSPTNWKPTHRRHFSGELLSVNPRIAKWLPGLFVLNERAVYLGQWEHGFFSYTAVGATNVGSIKVYFDRSLHTNQKRKTHRFKELCLGSGIDLKKGDLVGEFRMGSTIVVIFEAPFDFNFNVSVGTRVKLGQSLGCVKCDIDANNTQQKHNVRYGN